MIEVATGAAFLLSSLYGAGQVNAQASANVRPNTVSAIVRPLNNAKAVEAYLRKEFADVPILVEIARCESTFRQFNENGQVIRGKVDDADVGLLQINERYHADTAQKLGIDIYSIEGNMAFGRYLYGKYGTSPWSASKACWSNSGSLAKK